jgi:signal transduction histidine kinase
MVLFILFLITYLITSLDEQSHIKEELDMVSQVNTELNSYVALTEKIAEDRERKRIAREIHDTLGHALTGIAAGVDACIVLIDSDVDRTKQQLKIVSSVIREGIGDVRRSLNKLRPGALEDRTLKDAIIKMIDEYRELSKLNISLYYEWDYIDFDNTKEDILFRMIQESITNSLRHGHAKNVEINLFNTEQCYYIIIQDDGIGSEHITYGYGLKQMKERLAMIGGSVEYMGDHGFRTMAMIPKVKGEDKNDKSTNSR